MRLFTQPTDAQERPDRFFHADIWKKGLPPILIVGAGSLGNALALLLNAAGIDYITVDPDTWSNRNVFNNLLPGEPGTAKADIPHTFQDAVDKGLLKEKPFSIIVTATDSIESRAAVYRERLNNLYGYIDLRTGRDTLTIVTGSPEYLLDLLPQSDKVEELSCSERGTMYHTAVLAGHAAGIIVHTLQTDRPLPPQFFQYSVWTGRLFSR